jgi:hypothetical protein
MPETRSVTTNTINPTSLFPDTIPSTTPNREKHPCNNLRYARRAGPSTAPTVDLDHRFTGGTSIQ